MDLGRKTDLVWNHNTAVQANQVSVLPPGSKKWSGRQGNKTREREGGRERRERNREQKSRSYWYEINFKTIKGCLPYPKLYY